MVKIYSREIEKLNFGMMVELPQGTGNPPVTADLLVDTVTIKLKDRRDGLWVLTKSGRKLTRRQHDRYRLVAGHEKPLTMIYLPAEGEIAYWLEGFHKHVNVPFYGELYRLLVNYRFDEHNTIPKGTVVEYQYTTMTRYENSDHLNLVRYFSTTDKHQHQVSIFAMDCDGFLEPVL